MICYAMVGVKNLNEAATFFDNVLSVIGAKRLMEDDKFIVWGVTMEEPSFSVCLPYDGKEATSGNGTMISFYAESTDIVDKVYKVALENGATCEGEPGPRGKQFYAGYFRDKDGNKFNAFYPGQ
ncbi:MAG: VOC family protein [Emcibacteraceae bacterium]|nr:VOC family protein [Emcibacteraceae bacterium]